MSTRYRTIVADPPWHVLTPRAWDAIGTGIQVPYPTMTVKEIAALPVGDLAAPEAHLYLWTVNKYVEDAYGVARRWGFEPRQLLTWCKAPGRMMGPLFASTTEFILFARRGPQGGVVVSTRPIGGSGRGGRRR